MTIENARRDGVFVVERNLGSQRAGSIELVESGQHLSVLIKRRPQKEYVQVPIRYKVILNSNHSVATKYATLVHELAHLYCGHLGTPNEKWWPDRRDISLEEFRNLKRNRFVISFAFGWDREPFGEVPGGVFEDNETDDVPPISLECVMKSAGLIEQMGQLRLKLRKDPAAAG